MERAIPCPGGVELRSADRLEPIRINDLLGHVNRYTINSPQIPSSSFDLTALRANLPRLETAESFDGHPGKYWKFVRQFRYFVEQCVTDDGTRLQYLKHYYIGQAKEAISEIEGRDASRAYAMAWELLENLYGRDQLVANAIVEDLLKNLKKQHDGAESLSPLANRMRNCYIALQEGNHSGELDTLATLEKIVETLPDDARRGWARLNEE